MFNLFRRRRADEPAAPSLTQQLAAAVNADDLALVGHLLTQGTQPDDPDPHTTWTATQRAAANGRLAILEQLLRHGANPQQRDKTMGNTLLHLAANGMYPAVFGLLKKAGLDLNARNDLGRTPLFAAAGLDDVSGTLELLLLGADPALRDLTGHTAADAALAREQDPDNSWSTANARAVLAGWQQNDKPE